MTDTKYEPADIEIYVKNKGLVLKEKSLVAFDSYSKKILGIGDEAQALAAQDLESVAVQSPLRQGRVADYLMAVRMFEHMVHKVMVTIFACSYEKYKKEMAVVAPEKLDELHVIIVITKNEPERYVAEGLANVLQYAQEQCISADRVEEILRGMNKKEGN